MNKLTIQLNKKVSVFSIEHPREAAMFKYLSICAGLLVCAYLYLVCVSVLNVIAQREASAFSVSLQGHIGELEQRYFALSQQVTPEKAIELGFSPIVSRSYVYRLTMVGIRGDYHNAF